ncbi:BQ2448_258 [Microbotryum intermedium]|uniref:U6 snRNA phosphodiesterase 1 n=1 Tax=Microbotryum intermedium TaxID=269621 RepID=A0A238F533_9BASI|nr:BQ2448_258 [Microbotryum intermedium]
MGIKRKLPRIDLDDEPQVKAPSTTNPAALIEHDVATESKKHALRTRVYPHVQGQWPSHVFVTIQATESLQRIIQSCIARSQTLAIAEGASGESAVSPESIVSLFSEPFLATKSSRPALSSPQKEEKELDGLHLSLSRPLMLMTNQRQTLLDGVRKAAQAVEPFQARYATLAALENDERTTRFLGIEIGNGWDQPLHANLTSNTPLRRELNRLTRLIDQTVISLRLEPYYSQPRFHTSIAWTALTSSRPAGLDTLGKAPFPFDDGALKKMNDEFGKELRTIQIEVKQIDVKIGTKTTTFSLGHW